MRSPPQDETIKAVKEDDVDRVDVYILRKRGIQHATTNSLTYFILSILCLPACFLIISKRKSSDTNLTMNNHIITTPQDRRETLEKDLHLQADLMLRLTRDILIAKVRQPSTVATIIKTEIPKYAKRLEQVWTNLRTYRLPTFFDRFPDASFADYFTAAQTLFETAKVPFPVRDESLREPFDWN